MIWLIGATLTLLGGLAIGIAVDQAFDANQRPPRPPRPAQRAPRLPNGLPVPPQHRQTLQLAAVAVWGEPGDPINATELLPILEAA